MKDIDSIILIDDDEIALALNVITLEEMMMAKAILTFSAGQEALEHFKKTSFGLTNQQIILIVDLNMPGMDGEDFLRELSSLPFINQLNIRIIMYSAVLSPNKYRNLKNIGAHEFLEKPLTPINLSSVVEKLGFSSNLKLRQNFIVD